MQLSAAIGLLLLTVLRSVPQLQAKLAVRHAPISSEMLSNALYNQHNNNNNNNKNNKHNNIFDNDVSAYNLALDEDELEYFSALQHNGNKHNHNNNKFQANLTHRKQTNENAAAGDTAEVVQEEEEENFLAFADYYDVADAAGGKLKVAAEPAAAGSKSTPATANATTTTATTNALTTLQASVKSKSQSTLTTKAPAAVEQLQLTAYNSNSNNNNNRANNQPYAFANPFGQLGALFGSDQLHLQDYNLLFNAERHTVFQLHTAVQAGAITGGERVLLSGSIGAAFGVNAPPMPSTSATRVEEVQLYNASSLRQSRFNPFNPTRILIHGWFGGSHAGVYNALIPEYLKLGAGNYNVFTVDWGRGAIADYFTASYRVKPVGKVVAKFIDFLHEEAGISYDDLHVIGFSMGAHVAGITGKFVQTGRLPVIYALDPALPFFRYERIEERVSLVDADYVEVIHTSAGSYGYDQPLGHVDFYVNYGSNQPGCFFNECSHMRAYQVFAESLRSPVGFRGQGCDVQLWRDLAKHRRCRMGTGLQMTLGGDPKNASALRGRGGVYYVITNANAPYARALH